MHHLFEVIGVELEYMIVDDETLNVKPVADELIKSETGTYVSDVERGTIAWSNELASHVIELKTNGPSPGFDGLAEAFQSEVRYVNEKLERLGAKLLPTAMHPWMDPHTETKLWAHEHSAVYEAFNRIFDCRGHGWSNLQSTHLNFPFEGDDEFGRLHAAIRFLLPLLPALTAASPVMDGRVTGKADSRLAVYRDNCRRIPLVTGKVIPEAAFTRAEYEEKIFRPMYDAIGPFDAEGILQNEFLNARGAIARFDRNAIEIRVLDIQECPQADLAIAELIRNTLRALTEERWCGLQNLRAWPTDALATIYSDVVMNGENAVIDNPAYLEALGIPVSRSKAANVWRELSVRTESEGSGFLDVLWNEGSLSTRIRRRLGDSPAKNDLRAVYDELAHCLQEGRPFHGDPAASYRS